MIIEIACGYLGFLGIGHIYSGRALLGIILIFAWWLGLGLMLVLAATGIGALLSLLLFFGLPILSGTRARNYIQNAPAV